MYIKTYYWITFFLTGVIISGFFCSCKTASGKQSIGSAVAGAAVLSVVEEIRLDSCKVRQAVPFSLRLTNTGRSPLSVHRIEPSCDCVELLSEKRLQLDPEESREVKFVFTPETTGEIYREITFFSNAVHPEETVRVLAIVE